MQNNGTTTQQSKYITIGDPHEQGLVFKWGSLVGISLPSSGASGTPFRGAADVAFRPAGFTGTITDDWTTVPWCNTDFGNYGNPSIDHLATINDPVAGVGDICRHMGVIDSTNWRIPTQSELDELYRNGLQNGGEAIRIDNNSDWSDGLFAPLHGYAFGPHQSIVTIVSDIEVANADPNTNGAVFLPASGFRHPDYNGTIFWIGSCGFYWSSTALTTGNGYNIEFNSTTVAPQASHPRTYGFGVRCIRE